MNNKVVTIKDIALKANASTGTVDRVLHDRGKVSENVKERILKINKEMNYEPNLMARALESSKKYHLAALVPDAKYDFYWHAPKMGIKDSRFASKEVAYALLARLYLYKEDNAKAIEYANMAISFEGKRTGDLFRNNRQLSPEYPGFHSLDRYNQKIAPTAPRAIFLIPDRELKLNPNLTPNS